MKARLPLTCAQQKRIHDDMVREYGKVAEKEREDMTRRIIKAMLYILNTEFGWGVKRLTRLFNVFAKHINYSADDLVYWEHIDRVVIDQMGLPFERDYTDCGRVTSGEKK
jgi:hypothetical protein